MMLSYTRLFEVSILHDYFLDGVAKGIRLIPTEETAELMKKGRMLSRQTPKGLLVLYSSEEDRLTPEVSLTTPVHFHFWVQSDDPALFFAVTDLRKGGRTFKSGECLAFRSVPANASENQANPEKIQLDLWDGIRPKSQSIRLSLSPVPSKVLLQVKDPSGNQISSGFDSSGTPLPLDRELLPDDRGDFLLAIDLKGKPEGNYQVILRDAANTTDLWKKEYFLTHNPPSLSPVGVLRLSYPAAPDRLYGPMEYFAIDLKRKSTKWTYYIISQNKKVDLAAAQLSIQDKGNPPGSPYATYIFQQIGTAPNADVKVNNAETVIFKSQVPIPFFEGPKLNLELRRKPGNRVLFSHLPNPSRTGTVKVNPGEEISEIYVFI